MNNNGTTNGIKCYNCNEIGRIPRNCPQPRKMGSNQVPFVGHYNIKENFFDSFLSTESAKPKNNNFVNMTTVDLGYLGHTPGFHPTSPIPSWEELKEDLEMMEHKKKQKRSRTLFFVNYTQPTIQQMTGKLMVVRLVL
jgi:hypothetical protein